MAKGGIGVERFRFLMFRLATFLLPIYWGQRYSRVDRHPRRAELEAAANLSRAFGIIKQVFQNGRLPKLNTVVGERTYLERRFQAFTVLEAPHKSSGQLPPIEVLFTVHPKDFGVASLALEAAIQHTRNPIAKVAVVSPESDAARDELLASIPAGIPAEFYADAEIISPQLHVEVSEKFGRRMGWATQQLVKTAFVSNLASLPTLIIDSDTVMLRDKTWLYPNGAVLTYSRHFINDNYLRFLADWGVASFDKSRSFVTHHALMKPMILRNALTEAFGSVDAANIARSVKHSCDRLGTYEFALDYELYGQYAHHHHSAELQFDKYSNVERQRPQSQKQLEELVKKFRKQARYNTLSMHNRPG